MKYYALWVIGVVYAASLLLTPQFALVNDIARRLAEVAAGM